MYLELHWKYTGKRYLNLLTFRQVILTLSDIITFNLTHCINSFLYFSIYWNKISQTVLNILLNFFLANSLQMFLPYINGWVTDLISRYWYKHFNKLELAQSSYVWNRMLLLERTEPNKIYTFKSGLL